MTIASGQFVEMPDAIRARPKMGALFTLPWRQRHMLRQHRSICRCFPKENVPSLRFPTTIPGPAYSRAPEGHFDDEGRSPGRQGPRGESYPLPHQLPLLRPAPLPPKCLGGNQTAQYNQIPGESQPAYSPRYEKGAVKSIVMPALRFFALLFQLSYQASTLIA